MHQSLAWLDLRFKTEVLAPFPFAIPARLLRHDMWRPTDLLPDHPVVVLPAAIHGAVGREMHRLACRHSNSNCTCDPSSPCAFGELFERPDQLPPPLCVLPIARLPRNGFYYQVGEAFEFAVQILGPACRRASLVEHAVRSAGLAGIGPSGLLGPGRGRFELCSTDPIPGRSLPEKGSAIGAKIAFESPFVRQDEDGPSPPDFPELWKAARIRVIHHLDRHYGRGEWRSLVYDREADQRVDRVSVDLRSETWRQHIDPQRADGRPKLGCGFSGSVVYRGDLRPFWPILRLASSLGVGKSTNLGCGRFTLVPLESCCREQATWAPSVSHSCPAPPAATVSDLSPQ